MKKMILAAAVLASSMGYAQQTIKSTNHDLRSNPSTDKITLSQTQAIENPIGNLQQPTAEDKSTLGKARDDSYSFVKIGSTFYDLQTNAAVGRRLLLHDDGTFTAAWTFSGSMSTTFPDRGSGVNYYNGTTWGSFPAVSTENGTRTGWPSIGEIDGKVYTLAHSADGTGLRMTMNTGKGKTDWSSPKKVLDYVDGEPIWNRSATVGSTIHVLTNFSAQDTSKDVYINGMVNPTTYSRSFDGGATWVDEHIMLPGYDTSRYLSGGGDTYHIETRDSIVAIVIGGTTKDVSLWKSMDNGDTWTKTIADSFAYPAFTWGSKLIPEADRIEGNDGSVSCVIDNNGDVHIAFGRLGYYDTDTTDESMFVPQFYNAYHWSENFPTVKPCGTPIDMDFANDPNGSPYDFAAETNNSMTTDGPGNGLGYAARYGGTSISTHTSLSVGADNTIYVTWDAPVEFTYHDFGANFRDVHIGFSVDGGENFAVSQNATQLRETEAAFASQASVANDFVHFIFQNDAHPGTNLQNSGPGNLHPNVENTIYYAAIPVADIKDGVLGQNTLAAKNVTKDAKVFVVSQNYPNPFDGSTNVIVYLRSADELSYTVMDASGKVVAQEGLGYTSAGNHEFTINGSNLQAGVYFYTVKTGYNEVTRKMTIVK
ncbi:MAG: hypothetical protein ACI8ZN_000796 [Bacteroidia bacterium]|jgi:hypothetical protein